MPSAQKRVGRTEIRITGFGGQGVVLAGHIIGRACAIHSRSARHHDSELWTRGEGLGL